ncbi:hypothetical protein J3F84DRAFT_136828 [Trichoderma pleuroticola]
MSQAGHLARGLQMFLTTGAASEGGPAPLRSISFFLQVLFSFVVFHVRSASGREEYQRYIRVPMYKYEHSLRWRFLVRRIAMIIQSLWRVRCGSVIDRGSILLTSSVVANDCRFTGNGLEDTCNSGAFSTHVQVLAPALATRPVAFQALLQPSPSPGPPNHSWFSWPKPGGYPSGAILGSAVGLAALTTRGSTPGHIKYLTLPPTFFFSTILLANIISCGCPLLGARLFFDYPHGHSFC